MGAELAGGSGGLKGRPLSMCIDARRIPTKLYSGPENPFVSNRSAAELKSGDNLQTCLEVRWSLHSPEGRGTRLRFRECGTLARISTRQSADVPLLKSWKRYTQTCTSCVRKVRQIRGSVRRLLALFRQHLSRAHVSSILGCQSIRLVDIPGRC